MSRLIVLDTETTGLSAVDGDRIVELGCVELVNRKLTGNNLHFYINPERPNHEDAVKIHGLTDEFLADKPVFSVQTQPQPTQLPVTPVAVSAAKATQGEAMR